MDIDTNFNNIRLYLGFVTFSENEFAQFRALDSIIDGTKIDIFPPVIRMVLNHYVDRKAFELCQTDYKNLTPSEAKLKFLELAQVVLKQRLGDKYDKIVKL